MSHRPSLLVVTPLAPWPVRDGHTLRAAHLIAALAANWRVTLVAPPGPVPDDVEAIAVALPGASTFPWRYDSTPLGAAVDGLRQPFDRALVFAGAEAVWFGSDRPPAVLDLIDCNALEFWRAARTTRGLRARAYWLRQIASAVICARRGFRAFAATVCVGETDAAWLRRMGGLVHVVPNGVSMPEPLPATTAPVLGFTGSLDYHPNIDAARFAARAVFPLVRAAVPGARLLIAGRRPVVAVRALGALPGVEVVADPAEMGDVLARMMVALAPMRAGSGIKNKVLEAWAGARPVVMSRIAANGLTLPAGHAPLVGDGAAKQAEAAIALLREPARASALGNAARDHVAAHFSWRQQAARLDALLRQASRVDDDLKPDRNRPSPSP